MVKVASLVAVLLLMTSAPSIAATPPSAGYNDWTCHPSAAHPNPVVLVHGLGSNGSQNWAVIGPFLGQSGYCAFSLTYGVNPSLGPLWSQVGGMLPMEQSAVQLGQFVQQVLAATGAAKVDIVGHSEGSLMPDWYVKELGGSAFVDRYVAMTPLWHGTDPLLLGTLAAAGRSSGFDPAVVTGGCESCTEFLPGSAFLTKLNTPSAAVPGVTYTTLMTSHDELVQPYTSGYLDGTNVTNIVIQGQCAIDLSGHVWMAVDPLVEQDILNALSPATARPPPCSPLELPI